MNMLDDVPLMLRRAKQKREPVLPWAIMSVVAGIAMGFMAFWWFWR